MIIIAAVLPKFSPLYLRRTVFFVVVSKYMYTYHYLRISVYVLFDGIGVIAPYLHYRFFLFFFFFFFFWDSKLLNFGESIIRDLKLKSI